VHGADDAPARGYVRRMQTDRLRAFGENLWLAEGPPVSFLGFPYPTRMAVARLADGALWLWSPIALDAALRGEIEALGEPRYAVEPNKLHHLALGEWLAAWPGLEAWAPPGLARKRPDLDFAGELSDQAPTAWANEIDQVRVEGSLAMTEVLFFHRRSRTVLVCDLVQRHDPGSFVPWRRFVMRADGMIGPDGSTPREWRATFVRRGAARAALRQALAWEPERLVIAHGECAAEDGGQVLRRGLAWLGEGRR